MRHRFIWKIPPLDLRTFTSEALMFHLVLTLKQESIDLYLDIAKLSVFCTDISFKNTIIFTIHLKI